VVISKVEPFDILSPRFRSSSGSTMRAAVINSRAKDIDHSGIRSLAGVADLLHHAVSGR